MGCAPPNRRAASSTLRHKPRGARAQQASPPTLSYGCKKLVRSSTTSTKTHLSGQHSSDSRRARRPWSQRFPQRRPHKRCKPTGPAENCRTAHNVLETTVLPTPNRSGAPQEQQRALAVSKQYPTRGFQSLERPGKENTPNALLRGLGGLHQTDGGARRAAPSPPLAPRGAPGPGAPPRARCPPGAPPVPPRCPPGAPPAPPPRADLLNETNVKHRAPPHRPQLPGHRARLHATRTNIGPYKRLFPTDAESGADWLEAAEHN